VVDCEGDPDDTDKSKLVFRGAEKPVAVPDPIPADLGAAPVAGADE
jgi:ATP-dependent Clp protease ATP-binding subunit ClpC